MRCSNAVHVVLLACRPALVAAVPLRLPGFLGHLQEAEQQVSDLRIAPGPGFCPSGWASGTVAAARKPRALGRLHPARVGGHRGEFYSSRSCGGRARLQLVGPIRVRLLALPARRRVALTPLRSRVFWVIFWREGNGDRIYESPPAPGFHPCGLVPTAVARGWKPRAIVRLHLVWVAGLRARRLLQVGRGGIQLPGRPNARCEQEVGGTRHRCSDGRAPHKCVV
jgi:hypothetical protein